MQKTNNKKIVIILLGKSGCGKGTQAKLLQKKFGLDYIGSGDLLRARAKKNDFTGGKIASILLKGGLIPMVAAFKLWLDKAEALKKKKGLKGFVMDGNPRRILEAYLIDETLDFYEWGRDVKAILVDISDKEAIWRLAKRKICKNCREIIPFIGKFREMKQCPKCGGRLAQRKDDAIIEVIKKRLAWYRTEVQPIVNYYRKTGRLIKVNGEQPIENVFKDILKAIG